MEPIETEKEFKNIIENQNWLNAHFFKSWYPQALLNSGLIDTSPTGQGVINGFSEKANNVPKVIETGYAGYMYKEPDIPILGSTAIPEPLDAEYLTVHAKTFYSFWWWRVHTLAQDLMSMAHPNVALLIREHVGQYLATHLNHLMCKTVAGLSTISEITVGDDSTEFSEDLFDQAQKIREDVEDDGLSKIFMSSETLYDIKGKQNKTPNKSPLISQYQTNDQNQIQLSGGATGAIMGQTIKTSIGRPVKWAYKATHPIMLDNTMPDGLIAIIDPKAFVFMQKSFKKPLSYVNRTDEGGTGTEKFGAKFLFIMHPAGTDFIGTEGEGEEAGKYANRVGLTYAELERGAQYKLAFKARDSRIRLIKVKIGTS